MVEVLEVPRVAMLWRPLLARESPPHLAPDRRLAVGKDGDVMPEVDQPFGKLSDEQFGAAIGWWRDWDKGGSDKGDSHDFTWSRRKSGARRHSSVGGRQSSVSVVSHFLTIAWIARRQCLGCACCCGQGA